MAHRDATPAAQGYRMPPEWAPHQGTWFSWPHNPDTWGRRLEAVEAALARGVQALRAGETVHLNVLDDAHAARVRAVLDAAGPAPEAAFPVCLHAVPTDDSWCRDHGAIFVVRDAPDAPLAALNWQYNAWGGKYPPYDRDNNVPARMAEILNVPRFDADMVLEGGAVEVNGDGLVLTTTSCLLNPNRNPSLDRAVIERNVRTWLGVERVLWLEGDLQGDDTDGHIDNLVRFVAPDTVVAAVESDPADVNYAPLQDNLARLGEMTDRHGAPLRIIPLPMPEPYELDGIRMPASYANFYIGNEVVLVPRYGSRRDAEAMSVLQALFPDRKAVGFDCTQIIWGLGGPHCLSQQVPAAPARRPA